MARKIGLQFVAACAAVSIACSIDETVQPALYKVPELPIVPGAAVFASLELEPDSVSLVEGDEVQVVAVPRDQYGSIMRTLGDPHFIFFSSTPAVAEVSETGFVTAATPGTAEVSAKMTIGNYTRTAVMKVTVLPAVVSDTVVFTSRIDGWEPKVGHVKAGGIVQWRSGTGSYSGENATVHLLNMNYGGLDSFESKNGVASHIFASPGVYRFCAGGCWDPPDFGILYVD